jgi:hypothetical protein
MTRQEKNAREDKRDATKAFVANINGKSKIADFAIDHPIITVGAVLVAFGVALKAGSKLVDGGLSVAKAQMGRVSIAPMSSNF